MGKRHSKLQPIVKVEISPVIKIPSNQVDISNIGGDKTVFAADYTYVDILPAGRKK